MHKLSRKSVAIAAGTVLLLSGAGVAFAYWTDTGAGAGTGTTSNGTGTVTVNQTSSITGLYPGGAAQTLSGDFTNTNAGPAYVTAVTATGYTIDATHVTAGCTVAGGNYTLGGTAVVTGHDVAVGSPAAGSSWTGLTITMNDLGTNQDFCKGAILTITYASS
jgi:hypothetical protein